jgi:predicted PurR-regulated permease PerM
MNRRQAFMLAATGCIGLLAFVMLSSYTAYILTGLVLAFVVRPAHLYLRSLVGDSVSAFLTVLLTVLAAVLPFAAVLFLVAGDAASILSQISGIDFSFLSSVEQKVLEATGVELDLQGRLADASKSIASAALGSISGFLGAASNVAIGVSLMLFLQFYAVRDGGKFVEWTKGFDFMKDELQEKLYSRASLATWSVIKGHVLIAISQGILVGFGFFAFGISNAMFWMLVMMLLGFIPLVGSLMVWLPTSIYLMAYGRPTAGALLLVYSLITTTLADNFLRPFLVDEEADIHPFFIVIGVVSGIGVFGPAGIFLGPVTFAVLKAMLNMIRKHYKEL